MSRDTIALATALEALERQITTLVGHLRAERATAEAQHAVAAALADAGDLLQSHADDIDAGIIPDPRNTLAGPGRTR